MRAAIFILVLLAAAALCCYAVLRQSRRMGGRLFEYAAPPGQNYEKAEFRGWVPAGAGALRAVVVLVPGSNGDGKPMAEDPAWQEFAAHHRLALAGCRFTDRKHEPDFVEEYAAAARGSGQALLDAVAHFAASSSHPELAQAPLLLWGMSAGGQFNYEFTAWKPERVAAFVVNKGGVYYSALLPEAARKVPGIFFTGGQDMEFRNETIEGLFAVNRRAGALWALAVEPGAGHIVGRSRDLALIYFEDVLPLRLGKTGEGANAAPGLRPLTEESGFVGDARTKSFQPRGTGPAPDHPTSWLPSARSARAWQAMLTGQPF